MIPSLPQSDGVLARARRQEQLKAAAASLSYNHDTRIAPLGVAASLPKEYDFSLITLGGAATVILAQVDNALTLASPLVTPKGDRVMMPGLSDAEQRAAADCLGRLHELRERLNDHQARAVLGVAATPEAPARGIRALGKAVEELAHGVSAAERGLQALERGAETLKDNLQARLGRTSPQSPFEMLEMLVKTLLEDALKRVLEHVGLYGPASELYTYVRQFSILIPPPIVSTFEDDTAFSWLRLAGPNPMVISAIPALPDNLPLTDAQYQKVMGSDDSLSAAGAAGRLFLADYAQLASLAPSEFPDGRKYTAAPLALFATPADGSGRLTPVAIQLSQQPARNNPIIQPHDGAAWQLAKAWVNCADANHHEMVSHLGLTHLVVEGFAMATPRQLAPEHPLYVLLMPHFKGTLAINNSAVETLIAPKGVVDRLLAGTIESLTQLAVSSTLAADVSQMAPPVALAARGVDNPATLSGYAYRDDALLLWSAIEGWVNEYLSVYYGQDADISQDTELSAWLAELASPEGAGLKGIPSAPSFAELVSLVSTVIFTASVQHAAVNFPQSTVMSFTPALPLAMYTPPPSSTAVADGALVAALPPLQQSFVQLAFLNLLGGVYFTRLGDYDRYTGGAYFQDPRVSGPLTSFQRALIEVEREIGRRNMHRTAYTTLLPSAIPQSINI